MGSPTFFLFTQGDSFLDGFVSEDFEVSEIGLGARTRCGEADQATIAQDAFFATQKKFRFAAKGDVGAVGAGVDQGHRLVA